MGIVMKIIGALWGLLGVGNIIVMPWAEHNDVVLTVGVILNMLLFILPGLVVYGVGQMIKPKNGD